jgi:hypothetical protein
MHFGAHQHYLQGVSYLTVTFSVQHLAVNTCLNVLVNCSLLTDVLRVGKDDWGQLKAGVLFEECLPSDNDITCEVLTINCGYKVYVRGGAGRGR